MPFWPIVLAALVGVPAVLFITGMGVIFAAGGLAGGPQEARAKKIVAGWFAFAWVLVSVCGAFGLAPAWHAWHTGAESFEGGSRTFVHWLLGVGGVGLLAAAAVRAIAAMGAERASRSPPVVALRWLLLALGFLPWAAGAAWIAWPLAEWPSRGGFEWPDAATGWRHTGEIAALLIVAMLVEEAIRALRKR